MADMLIPAGVALVLGFIAWKALKGMIKIGALVVLVGAAVYFLSQGGLDALG